MPNYPLYIAIALLLCLVLVFGLVLPQYRILSSLDQYILKKEMEFRSQENYFQEIQKISERLKENQEPILKIKSALPEDRLLADLLNFFQKAASQSGTTLREIIPLFLPTEKGQRIKATKVNLVLTGEYSSFKNFLFIVENSSRLIEIENVYFSYPEKGPLSFNISTKVYSY